jgi:hypothetical protein
LRRNIDGFQNNFLCGFVATGLGEETIRNLCGHIVNQLVVEVTTDAAAGKFHFHVIPAIRFDAALDVLAEAVLVELNRMFAIAPAADVPPIFVLAFATEGDQKAFGAVKFPRLER